MQNNYEFKRRLRDIDYRFPEFAEPSPELVDFLKQIFRKQDDRPSANELLKHVWLRDEKLPPAAPPKKPSRFS